LTGNERDRLADAAATEPQPIVVISCFVFEQMLRRLLPAELAERAVFLDYALHVRPNLLLDRLQQLIDALPRPSIVILGYGLCGNGTAGLRSGRHTLILPRTDDCIAVLLGSREKYASEFSASPGTYYLTKGWLESASNPLVQFEEYQKQYDEETAWWLMDQQYANYRRLVFVGHSQAEVEECRPRVRAIADFCRRWDMEYAEIIGTDAFVRRLVAAGLGPDPAREDLLVIRPGEVVTQDLFRA